MKILKYPKFNTIECDCGCVFIADSNEDIETEELQSIVFIYKRNFVRCPICGEKHYKILLKEKK